MSECPASTEPLKEGLSVPVVVYNNLGWPREEVVFIPVGVSHVIVRDTSAQVVSSQTFTRDGTFVVAFNAKISALGYTTYVISPSEGETTNPAISFPQENTTITNFTPFNSVPNRAYPPSISMETPFSWNIFGITLPRVTVKAGYLKPRGRTCSDLTARSLTLSVPP